MRRWLFFLLAIMIGVGVGLLLGFVISPIEYKDTTLEQLKIDYQTDYILMVAEAYQADQDIGLAMARLDALKPEPPAWLVGQALAFAEQVGYAERDLNLLRLLQADLQVINGAGEALNP